MPARFRKDFLPANRRKGFAFPSLPPATIVIVASLRPLGELARHRALPIYGATTFGVAFFGLPTGVAAGHAQILVKPMNDHTHVPLDGTLTSLTVPKLLPFAEGAR